jgi:hypothetical protein
MRLDCRDVSSATSPNTSAAAVVADLAHTAGRALFLEAGGGRSSGNYQSHADRTQELGTVVKLRYEYHEKDEVIAGLEPLGHYLQAVSLPYIWWRALPAQPLAASFGAYIRTLQLVPWKDETNFKEPPTQAGWRELLAALPVLQNLCIKLGTYNNYGATPAFINGTVMTLKSAWLAQQSSDGPRQARALHVFIETRRVLRSQPNISMPDFQVNYVGWNQWALTSTDPIWVRLGL